MDILKITNQFARLYNKIVMLTLSISIFLVFVFVSATGGEFDSSSIPGRALMILWSLFTLISIVYSINGYLLHKNFNQALDRKRAIGKPLEGIRGFDEFHEGIMRSRIFSYLITIGSFASLIVFIFALNSEFGFANERNFRLLLISFAMTFAFITISLLFILEYPEELSFNPGGLIGFYEPDHFPVILDNILFDIFHAYLDPISIYDIDEWSQILLDHLDDSFEADETQLTRMETARERILLLLYLHSSNNELVNNEVLDLELAEIVGEEHLDLLKQGMDTGLSLQEIQNIIIRVEKLAPEPFRLVDRLTVNLVDDYEVFINKDIYFTISTNTNQGAVLESTGILVYVLNNSNRKSREIHLELIGGRQKIHPHYQDVILNLDHMVDLFPKEQPPLVSHNSEDIIGLLSDILSSGDAAFFRIHPEGFGYNVITIKGTTNDEQPLRFAEALEMRFTRSIKYYVKNYLPKLSGLASIALPIIQGFIGFSL